MATIEEVQEVNAGGVLVDWSPCRASCPACGRKTVEVRQCFQLQKLGTFSLAGGVTKFPARLGWVYRCTACQATGPAEPT
jgi:hypothetical protein